MPQGPVLSTHRREVLVQHLALAHLGSRALLLGRASAGWVCTEAGAGVGAPVATQSASAAVTTRGLHF